MKSESPNVLNCGITSEKCIGIKGFESWRKEFLHSQSVGQKQQNFKRRKTKNGVKCEACDLQNLRNDFGA